MDPTGAALFFDFRIAPEDLAGQGRPLLLRGLRWEPGRPLEFTQALQFAEVDPPGMAHLARALDGIRAMTIGGWFYPIRAGEQCFLSRGQPEIAPQGERLFPPHERRVRFCLGMDARGFLMGALHGNGRMPFPHVTLCELRIDTWYQIALVKDAEGYQKFYVNGRLVHTDRDSVWAPQIRPFRETDPPELEPVRLAMPQGGRIAEAWVYPRELSEEELRADYLAARERYRPAPPVDVPLLREMNAHPAADLWPEPITAESWPRQRARILEGVRRLFGPFPRSSRGSSPRWTAAAGSAGRSPSRSSRETGCRPTS